MWRRNNLAMWIRNNLNFSFIKRKNYIRISSLRWADMLVVSGFFAMQNYLTGVWGLSFTHAAAIINIWGGICMVLPVFCRYFVDEFLGHFRMLVLGNVAYSVGVVFLVMSAPPVLANSTGTCKQYESNCIGNTQKVFLYTGMSLIAVGMSGNKVSLTPFLDKHMTKEDKEMKVKRGVIILSFIVEIVVTLTVWTVHFPVPWALIFWIPAGCTVVATFVFLSGYYSYDTAPDMEGSPFTKVFMVLVVSITKMFKNGGSNDQAPNVPKLPGRFYMGIFKAAIVDSNEPTPNQMQCTVAEVQETIISLRMIPVWISFMICSIVSSIGNTYFVEQANHMNHKIGKWNVPLQMLLLFSTGARTCLTGFLRKSLWETEEELLEGIPTLTHKPRIGTRPAIVVGMAMILSVLCCITAALVEKMRLGVIRRNDLLDKPDHDTPLSALWLGFQFYLVGGLDSFLQNGMIAFYAQESPGSWEGYLEHFAGGVSGLGYMSSVFTVYVVGRISERGGRPNWFQFTLSKSRLDKYYWVLAGVSALNFVIFILVATWFYGGRGVMEDEEQPNTGDDAPERGVMEDEEQPNTGDDVPDIFVKIL